VDEVGLHTDGWPLAELDHLAQTHAGSREVCIMADRVHELSRLFPRHGCACRGLAAKSPRGVDKLASSGYVLANAQQRRSDKSGVTVVCGIAGRSSSKRAESESRVREGRPRHRRSFPSCAHCTFPSSQNLHRTELIHLPSHAEA
jgi:hypothetical protein